MALSAGFGLADTTAQPAAAQNGSPVSGDPSMYRSAVWQGGTTINVWTLTIGSAANQDYGFDIVTPSGESFSPRFTRAGSETTAQIAEAVQDAARAIPGLTAWADVTASASTVVITAQLPGTAGALAVTEALANQTLAETTAAADGQSLPLGRLVAQDGFDGATPIAKPLGDVLSAQSATVTVVYEAGVIYVATINGESIGIGADTDSATTAAIIVDALAAVTPDNVTITDNSDGTFDVDADIPGVSFTLDVGVNGAATTGTISIAGDAAPTAANDLGLALLGISRLDAACPKPMDDGAPAWPDGDAAVLQTSGGIFCAISGTHTAGGDLFVDVSGGANDGLLFAASGANRCPIPSSLIKSERTTGSLVQIRFA